MSLFQITMLVLLCILVCLNLLVIYIDRTKWTNAFTAGLCVGTILHLIANIISK